MPYFKRIIANDLYPPFLRLVERLHANCLARGAHYYATSGYRSIEEQDRLYALGRTVANSDATPEKPLGSVVTNARGGQSYHNFRIAIDFALDGDTARAGLQPDWRPEAYRILGEEAAKLGLEWGGGWKFKDYPHVQLRIGRGGLKLADLLSAYHRGGDSQVRALLDRYRW